MIEAIIVREALVRAHNRWHVTSTSTVQDWWDCVQVRWLLVLPGYWFLRLLQRMLGKQLLMACEVAMEYLLALTNSPQVIVGPHFVIP